MCVFFSHKKGSKKTGLTPTSNFPGGPLEEAQTRVPTCHICHVCHICLCHVGFSNFTEVLAQSCCKTFKASKSSKYSKRYFQQRLPWFRWYADIRRYAHAQHLLTAVDLTCFLVSGPTESRLLSSVSGRCIGALVGHQTLQEAFGGCRSDSSVWPGVPPLVRHSDQTCLKHEWIRTNEHGFRSATRNREKIFRFLWICISLSLCLDSFCLPIAMRSSFVCLLFKHLVFLILVVKGQETRFPKRLSLDETMKQGWSLRWNVAVAIMRTMPFAKAIWVILATSELCLPRGPQHVTPYQIVKHQTLNPKKTRVLARLRSYALMQWDPIDSWQYERISKLAQTDRMIPHDRLSHQVTSRQFPSIQLGGQSFCWTWAVRNRKGLRGCDSRLRA